MFRHGGQSAQGRVLPIAAWRFEVVHVHCMRQHPATNRHSGVQTSVPLRKRPFNYSTRDVDGCFIGSCRHSGYEVNGLSGMAVSENIERSFPTDSVDEVSEKARC